MERCLISGSHGFIGQKLYQELSHQGLEVLRLERDWTELPEVDYIFHLASYGNKYSQTSEQMTFEVNVSQLWRLLKASEKMDYKGFVNFSTSTHVQDSNTFYGATKACGEHLVAAFATKNHKPALSVRPFSVYGDGDDPAHFIPTAIQAFKEDGPLKLAPGIHDWIHVDDFVSAVILLSKHAAKLKGQGVDIGTGRETTNAEIVAILREISCRPGRIERVGKMRDYDGGSWRADNGVLLDLGWKWQIPLDKGLERLYYAEN